MHSLSRLTRALAGLLMVFTGTLSLGGCHKHDGGQPPAPPVISSQPAGLTVNAGDSATFQVSATGATGYQWKRNGQNIAGATQASYALTAATSANNGDSYTVTASNAGGSVTSSAAVLRVTGISVIAGQIGGQGYADGDASEARFWGPAALALDSGGNLYVADYNAVRKITPAGAVSTIVGTPRTCGEQSGSGAGALLCYPYALALDAADNLYVADYLGTTVWRIDANGTMSAFSTNFSCIESLAISGSILFVGDSCGPAGALKTLDTGAPGLPATFANINGPIAGVSFDAGQNVYIADDTTVDEVTAGPVVSTLAGTAGVHGSADGQGAAAQFGCIPYYYGANLIGTWGATAIATLPSGTSFVADFCHNTIRQVTAAGTVTTFAGTPSVIGSANGTGQGAAFFQPAAIVLDPSGNLLVADYSNAMIRKITPAGVVSTYAGQTPHEGHADGPVNQATFCDPYGVVVDSAGNLYVSDTLNYTIRKIAPNGTVSTLAGIAGTPGAADGDAKNATFAYPQDIAIDAAGNLFVNDMLNQTVRKVTPVGVVSTFARLPQQSYIQLAGVAVDKSGNVFITNHDGVYEVGPDGGVAMKIAALTGASAITVAPNGMIYVTAGQPFTSGVGAVYSLSSSNELTLVAGTGLSNRLQGIVMGGDGDLYVADVANSVIVQVTPAGAVTTVAGSAQLPMLTTPGGLPGKINSPRGMALLPGSAVSLAVVDSFEHAVLRVDLP